MSERKSTNADGARGKPIAFRVSLRACRVVPLRSSLPIFKVAAGCRRRWLGDQTPECPWNASLAACGRAEGLSCETCVVTWR